MAGDSDYPKTVLLVDCSGFANNTTNLTGIDKAYTTAKTLTCNGNAKISTALGYPALAFDGTGDFVSFPDTADLDFTAGAGTIEAEVYIAGNSAADVSGSKLATIISNFNSADATYWAFYVSGNATTTGTGLTFQSNVATKGITATVSQSALHHLAVSWDATGVYFAINGVVTATTAFASNIIGGTQPRIGKLDVAGYLRELNGYIKSLRITNGVARYKANFTPVTPFPDYVSSIAYTLTESIAATQFRLILSKISDGALVSSSVVTTSGEIKYKTVQTGHFCMTIVPIQGDKWKSGTAYALNDLVMPTTPHTTPYYFKRVGNAGTSGATEPVWNTAVAGQCNDGVWTNCWERIERLTQPIVHSPIINI